MPRQLLFGAALLLLLAVSAQASRWSLETDEQGRHLLQVAKSPNCTRVNKHCAVCRNQRIPGTRRSELVCSQCEAGYRLRRDGTSKICDCAPGLEMNGAGNCQLCEQGKFCPGGDAANPESTSSNCPDGLATTFAGAKSQAQCFTIAGHGRVSTKGSDGKVTLSAVVCEAGTYNVGSNTAGCQRCGAGLTTATNTSTSAAACVAPAGSYMDKGIGKLCQRGTYSTDYNSNSACTPCPDGITTALEGRDSADDCSLAMKGYYINASDPTQAIKCPVDTYQDKEIATTACTPCPYGWRTKEAGATGVALCLAPPGYELKDNATTITACEKNFYKADWNRNPCVACGTNIITKEEGSVSKDACLVPAGYGLTSLSPMVAAPCEKNTYGHAVDRVAVANARCTACPTNMLTADVLENNRALNPEELYKDETACLVRPGWGVTSTIPQECPVGTYNEGMNRLPCQHCATGFTTEAAGKTLESQCYIQPGWHMAADGIPAPCDKGTYSTGGTEGAPNATCTPCDDGFSTQEDEATNSAECAVCAPGYGGNGATCSKCPAGKYSFGGGSVDVACEDCAAGSTSAEAATHPQQCYSTLIDARNDVFNLADEADWVAQDVSVDTAAECGAACTNLASCVMYKFDIVNAGTGAGNCSLYIDAGEGPTHFAGFKVSDGADYSRWPVNQIIGAAVDPQPQAATDAANEAACLAACTASAECEVYLWRLGEGEGSPCTLTKSELEQAAISMFQVRGEKLYSYTSVQALLPI